MASVTSRRQDNLSRRLEFWVPQFGAEEKALVARVIDSGFINDGEVTAQFEKRMAESLGCKHVVATTSGTTAIFLALAGIGVGAGDEVIVPDVTFIATANAVTLTGAKPVLVDIEPKRLTLDPQRTEDAITARTKAIVPVHVSGRAADLDAILDIANRHDLLVVEDAAEALFSKHNGKALGTFGIAGCFSLSPNKTLTTGQGGLIATDDDRLQGRLRELKDQGRPVRGTGGDDVHSSIGFNFKFTNLQAAVGLAQLKDVERRLSRMRSIYRGYEEGLRDLKGISTLPFRIEDGEVPQWTDVLADHCHELYDHLASKGIRGRRFWHPLHTQKPYRMPNDRFPNSLKYIPRAMWLPSAFTLSDADVVTVCDEIREFLGHIPAGRQPVESTV
jgi:perosamine synthetase